MAVALAERLVSPDEYLAAEMVAEEKHEYLAGRVVAMSGARKRHTRLSLNLTFAIRQRIDLDEHDVLALDQRTMAANRKQYTYPDVVVLADAEGQFEDPEEFNLLNPLLIVEVLSRTTERRDRGEKFDGYKLIDSLQEYILVAQTDHRVEQFRRRDDWKQIVYQGLESVVRLDSLGIDIPLAEIYARVKVSPYTLSRDR